MDIDFQIINKTGDFNFCRTNQIFFYQHSFAIQINKSPILYLG